MFAAPMLLEQTDKPFTNSNYIFEPKFDGHRLLFEKQNGVVRLFTRHGTEVTSRYPELLDLPIDDVVLDGEVVCLDGETGRVDFELIMKRFSTTSKVKIARLQSQLSVYFMVFDVLSYQGKDLRHLDLMTRKARLAAILPKHPHVHLVPFAEDDGHALYQTILQQDLEGMVAKRKSSTYQSRRSKDWQKIINYKFETVFITGYKKGEFGWFVAKDEGNRLRPVGCIELGVPPVAKKAFYRVSRELVVKEDDKSVYLTPAFRVKVKFRNWTRTNLLRSPVFVDFVLEGRQAT